MELNVNVPAQDIEKAIVQAVIDTALGQRIREAVEGWMKAPQDRWTGDNLQSRIDKELSGFVNDEVRKWVLQEYGAVVRERIMAGVSKKSIDAAIDATLEKLGWRGNP